MHRPVMYPTIPDRIGSDVIMRPNPPRAKLLQLPLLDHVVVSAHGYFSYAEAGRL